MKECCKLMQDIYELGFAIDDLVLFLDTHPQDEQALSLYEKLKYEYIEKRKEYVNLCGPLMSFDVNTKKQYGYRNSKYYKMSWSWGNKPMPWEGEF